MSKREVAMAHFRNGCNCAQSVFLAFADLCGFTPEKALRLSSPFGGGLGHQREICGAVSGMSMVLGILYGWEDIANKDGKTELYALTQELCNRFKEKNQTIICRELLGDETAYASDKPQDRTETYYKERPCERLVGDAAEIMENYIAAHPIKK